MQRCKTFFACGSSAPVRVEGEGGTAACLAGTLAAPGDLAAWDRVLLRVTTQVLLGYI